MTSEDDIRRVALALPEAYEEGHHGIPSFRVNKKIFCTIHLDRPRIVLKLEREDQLNLAQARPGVVEPADWSPQHGWTYVWRERAGTGEVEAWLRMAWAAVAPKRLLKAQANA